MSVVLTPVMRKVMRLVVPAILAALVSASTASAQVQATPAKQNSSDQKAYSPVFPETTPYPVDVDRVKHYVEQTPVIRIDDQQLRFYALTIAKQQAFFEKFAKDYDFRNGPTRGGAPMTHQEFLSMVTPKELNELFGATSGSSFAMFQAAVMNAAGQALIKKGLKELHDARSEREIAAIRQRINRELEALLGKVQ